MINKIRTKGIPLWVTIFAILLFLMSILVSIIMIATQLNSDIMAEYISLPYTLSMVGRNIGLGLIVGLAVILKKPVVYFVAFIGSLCLEFGNIFNSLLLPKIEVGVVVVSILLIIINIYAIYISNKARKLG